MQTARSDVCEMLAAQAYHFTRLPEKVVWQNRNLKNILQKKKHEVFIYRYPEIDAEILPIFDIVPMKFGDCEKEVSDYWKKYYEELGVPVPVGQPGTNPGQTHYKMISCNIWLPVVIHRSKTRNNALDVFWGTETIIMPLSRQPQKKSFCPVSHSLAPNFMKIFFIMRLP